jgi:hypothetical protein
MDIRKDAVGFVAMSPTRFIRRPISLGPVVAPMAVARNMVAADIIMGFKGSCCLRPMQTARAFMNRRP